MEKCVFGTNKGVLHYVLKRELALPRKNVDFELEICVKERGGRAARCMGSVPVADLLASEARRSRTSGHISSAYGRTETPLYAFSRAIDRESLAGLCNSLKLCHRTGRAEEPEDISWPSSPIGVVSCTAFVLCHRTGRRGGELYCMCTMS